MNSAATTSRLPKIGYMSNTEDYDALVLGSGEAGKYLAWNFAKAGKRTAVIEQKYVGGSCPNIACLPSKNIIHSAKIASYFQKSEEFGITKDNWAVRMPGVRDRKRKMVDGLVEMHLGRYRASGAELVMGHGRFVAPKIIEVGARTLRGERIIISTGSRTTIEPIPGLREANPMTHIEALELDHLPGHVLVLGGGYIGLELAQALRRFGSRVTIVERNDRLAHREDPDISDALHALFNDEGITISTNVTVERVSGQSGDLVRLHVAQNGSDVTIEGTPGCHRPHSEYWRH
jgi:pyruvate/2-oxoglutarate dehydrogenase complex dihydrolipoamide dehydrogenase (E3) component